MGAQGQVGAGSDRYLGYPNERHSLVTHYEDSCTTIQVVPPKHEACG